MTSGHDGTPPQGKDFGDFLRRSLHAAADHIEPSVEGLERIRARVRSGPAHASRAASGSASSGFLADAVRRWNALRGGHGSTPGHRARRARDWREALIRPAIALACAVFVAGAVLASFAPLRDALTSSVSAALDGQKTPSASSSAAGGGGKALTGGAGSVTTPAASQPALIVSCPPSSAATSPTSPSSASVSSPATSTPATTARPRVGRTRVVRIPLPSSSASDSGISTR